MKKPLEGLNMTKSQKFCVIGLIVVVFAIGVNVGKNNGSAITAAIENPVKYTQEQIYNTGFKAGYDKAMADVDKRSAWEKVKNIF